MILHTRPVRTGVARALVVAFLIAAFLIAGISLAAAPSAASADESDSDFSVTVPETNESGENPPSPSPSGSPTPKPEESEKPSDGGGSGGSGGSGDSSGTTTTPDGTTSTPECTPTEPTVPTVPATTGEKATVDKDVYLVGDEVTATTTGFGAGEQVQLVLFSDPQLIGTFTADADGAVRAEFPVADTVLPGTHTLQFTGWCERITLVDVLVGSDAGGDAASAGAGIPVWAWWIGGGLGVVALLAAGWQIMRLMREPAASLEVATP